MKKYLPAGLMWLLFELIAVALWLALDNVFYLLNFSYIGLALGLGLAMYAAKLRYARNFVQFAVGIYMLIYLGFLVLPLSRRIRGSSNTLRSDEDFRAGAVRQGLVRLCLLDGHGAGSASVQDPAGGTQEFRICELHTVCSFARLCRRAVPA